MILKANCKINLGLDILRRRADGFHDLETVMFPVAGLYDEVEVVRTAAPGAEFRAEGLAVDCAPGENICLKAFRLMQRHYGVDGVAIRLGKRVPFGAGLGGGSSDGTAVLLAVNELFALGLSEAELIALRDRCAAQLAAIVHSDEEIAQAEAALSEAAEKTATLADRLHKTREKAAAGFEKHILSTLARLGMPETVFRIALTPLAEPGRTGRDSVQFLFTANPRMTPQPVERIASGGELSRVMLALKALLAERMQLPTIIFDEIDTGVSGRIADAMGEIIASLSASMQVVDITHLPQVASKGTAHFVVYKRGGRTDITRLGDEERVTEIAKMLSGSEITDAAVAQARILLGK